jgi:hypothetical protein
MTDTMLKRRGVQLNAPPMIAINVLFRPVKIVVLVLSRFLEESMSLRANSSAPLLVNKRAASLSSSRSA